MPWRSASVPQSFQGLNDDAAGVRTGLGLVCDHPCRWNGNGLDGTCSGPIATCSTATRGGLRTHVVVQRNRIRESTSSRASCRRARPGTVPADRRTRSCGCQWPTDGACRPRQPSRASGDHRVRSGARDAANRHPSAREPDDDDQHPHEQAPIATARPARQPARQLGRRPVRDPSP